MQVLSEPDAAAHFDRILAREVPGGRGLKAWDALLRAHATLLRQLETDLESKTGLALADFDVLAQLAIAGGSLRMTELADRGPAGSPAVKPGGPGGGGVEAGSRGRRKGSMRNGTRAIRPGEGGKACLAENWGGHKQNAKEE